MASKFWPVLAGLFPAMAYGSTGPLGELLVVLMTVQATVVWAIALPIASARRARKKLSCFLVSFTLCALLGGAAVLGPLYLLGWIFPQQIDAALRYVWIVPLLSACAGGIAAYALPHVRTFNDEHD